MDFLPGNDYNDWQILGDDDHNVLYQQVTVQEPMGWSGLSLDCYKVACGKYSGPIALKWNSDETLPLDPDVSLTTDILIYDSCGKKITQIPGKEWQYARMVVMGWTSTEKLFLVFEDGQYLIFSNSGEKLHQSSIFKEKLSDVVFNANASEDGFVAFTKNNHIWYVDCSGEEPIQMAYPDLNLVTGIRVDCSCVLEARHSETKFPEFVAHCTDEVILIITRDNITTINILDQIQGSIVAMAPCPSNNYIACFNNEGWLDVFDRSFSDKVMTTCTECRVAPQGFAWCGDDSVVLYWRTLGLLLINPFAEWLKYTYSKDDTLLLVTECDSLRVYSSLKHEIIRCAPPSLCEVYSDNSCGAQLRHAYDQFVRRDRNAQLLRGDTAQERHLLYHGVLECLDAAEDELSTSNQEALLRSAKFGKCFLDGANVKEVTCEEEEEVKESEADSVHVTPESTNSVSETVIIVISYNTQTESAEPSHSTPENPSMSIVTRFQDVSRALRVLNTLRDPSISMYLTFKQYQTLGHQHLLQRLLYRHLYYLALKICTYLALDPDFVLIDWACQKVRRASDISDEDCRNQIRENLCAYKNISYQDIAEVAFEVGRKQLAAMLLEFEPRRADRIPLLLRMGELQLALRTAANSNDSDLMMMVALELYDKSSESVSASLLDLLRHFPRIFNSWLYYLQQSNQSRLVQIMSSLQRYEDVFDLLISNAFQEQDLSKRKDGLGRVKSTMAGLVSAGRKDLQFYVHTVQDEMTLIDYKLKLIHHMKNMDCANMTVVECLRYAVVNNKVDIADSLAKALKVPEKRYWRIKVDALAEAGLYDILAVLGEKRSPIGYIPFVNACIKWKNRNEAKLYLAKIKNDEERMQTALKHGMYEDAYPSAVKLRDVEALMKILTNARNDAFKNEVTAAIRTIEGNKLKKLCVC